MKWQMALLLIGLLGAASRGAGADPVLPDLPLISVEAYVAVHHDDGVLTVELRSDAAIGAAMFELPVRPSAIEQVPQGCLAVFVMDETTVAAEAGQAADRLEAAGCSVFRLAGHAEDWISAGLAGPAEPKKRVRPGDVPFVVPRGLCESNPPAQVFH